MDFEHPPHPPPKYDKPTFLPHHTLYNICYEFAIIFINSYFSAIFHTKNKKNIAKNTPISYRYHSEGSAHPK